ncbi:MAG: GNAT family N-acetyltransferase [Acidimicrobiales bacterium]
MAEDAAWLDERPPELIEVGDRVLIRMAPDHASELVMAVNASLSHLRPWMPWAQEPATSESIGTFLGNATTEWEGFLEFQYLIRQRLAGPVIGCCGLHTRVGVGALEIGYWVHVDHIGRGVATAAAGGLTDAALRLRGVERAEIRCDAANARSAAIPPKLGYRLDRIEPRRPTTPGETDAHMVWVRDRP